MKCKYCGEEFDNPQIFMIHENNCLDHQKQNGLLKQDSEENIEEDQQESEEEKKKSKRAAKKAGEE